jgi:hypothetical protein
MPRRHLPRTAASTGGIATLFGHKTHSITSRYMHSADVVLLAAADAVANATMKLMAEEGSHCGKAVNSQGLPVHSEEAGSP